MFGECDRGICTPAFLAADAIVGQWPHFGLIARERDQGIVDPTPFFPGDYHCGLPQDGQMTGQCRLANFQSIDQLTDTDFGAQQGSENACGIRDRLSKVLELLHKLPKFRASLG
jgi:hypothetical protein